MAKAISGELAVTEDGIRLFPQAYVPSREIKALIKELAKVRQMTEQLENIHLADPAVTQDTIRSVLNTVADLSNYANNLACKVAS